MLDHRIPCLAFAVEEPRHVNVWKNRLDALGLPPGPWLRTAKQAILDKAPDDAVLRIPTRLAGGGRELSVGELKREAMRIVPGQKFAYVVDAAYTPENVRRIVALTARADILFIEAPLARDDEALAADRAHLTTDQAGRIARRAGVARVEPFHFSPRYTDASERLRAEVAAAFAGEAASTRGPAPARFAAG